MESESASGQFLREKGMKKITLSSSRYFLCYSPSTPQKQMPLLIFYHGKLGTAEKYIRKSNWIQKAEELKFVVCFGQAQGVFLSSFRFHLSRL
jgi:poly(3-hydroxybutyrate) depolymerase